MRARLTFCETARAPDLHNSAACLQLVSSAAPRQVCEDTIEPAQGLLMEEFQGALRPISNLPSSPLFTHTKGMSQEPVCLPSDPLKDTPSTRYGMTTRGQSLSHEYETESNALHSFDLEYALLEQALHKDDGTPIDEPSTSEHTGVVKRDSPGILEPEYFFSDILGDNGVPSPSLSAVGNKEETAQDRATLMQETNKGAFLRSYNNREDVGAAGCAATMQMDQDLTSALASLVGSDVSVDEGHPTSLPPLQCDVGKISYPRRKPDGCFHRHINKRGAAHLHAPADLPVLDDAQGFMSLGSGAASGTRPSSLGSTEDGGIAKTEGSFLHISADSRISEEAAQSPLSDSSMSGLHVGQHTGLHLPPHPEAGRFAHTDLNMDSHATVQITPHPDLYESLSPRIQRTIDRLHAKIKPMPRRKLRESLSQGVTLEDVEPLMGVNRDDLARMIGLGVTTWKMFVHHTLGIPRWPARALKSEQAKERKLVAKKIEAERKGEMEVARRAERELARVAQVHMRRRKLFRTDAKLRVASGGVAKQRGGRSG